MRRFIIAHSLVILLSLAISFFGMFMLQILCYILGGIIILYGLLCLLNTYVFTGVFDSFGNEYVVTNLEGNLWTLLFSFLFGCYVFAIPFTDGEYALKFFMFIPIGLLVWVLSKEWEKFDGDVLISILDIAIPVCYLGTGVLYNVLVEVEAITQLCVIPICIGILMHIYRTIYVCKEYSL